MFSDNMDKIDKKILNILLDDTRLSYRQMAKKLNIATATVAARIRRMEKKNIIKKYSAILDYGKLDYDVEVIIYVRTARGKDIEAMKKIATDPSISAIYDIIGEFDVALLAKFKNRDDLDAFLHKVRGYEFIERTHTTIILHTFKESIVKL